MAWGLSELLLIAGLVQHHHCLPMINFATVLRAQDAEVELGGNTMTVVGDEEPARITSLHFRKESWPVQNSGKALNSRRPDKFLKYYNCQREPAVDESLEFLQTSGVQLSRSFLTQQLERMQGDGVLFTIENQSVSFEVNETHPKKLLLHDRSEILRSMVADIAKEVEIPSMQFLFNPMDGAHSGEYGVMKREGRPGKDLLAIAPSLSYWGYQVQESASRASWNCRRKQRSFAVFRGTTTGLWNLTCDDLTPKATCKLDDISCSNCTRALVLQASMLRPDLLDAGIVRIFGQYKAHSKMLTGLLRENGLFKNFASDEEQACYSAVVVVDGDALPDRLPKQLGYGLPTVFVHPAGTDEFWYPELRPGVNYIPASTENLTDVLEDLRNNPDVARSIGEQGRQFVLNNLSERRLRCYLYTLLSSYAKMYRPNG